MKAKVSTQALARLLSLAASLAPRKPTIPALSMVRIESGAQHDEPAIKVCATDLDMHLVSSVPCEVQETGACAVSAHLISEIVGEVADEKLSLQAKLKALHIGCADGQFKTVRGDESEFPSPPKLEASSTAVLPCGQLMDMVKLTSFAVSTETVRYALTGILLDLNGEKCTLAASDGRRLSLVSHAVEGNPGAIKVILPPRALELAGRLFSRDSMLVLSVGESGVSFTDGISTLHTRVIEGSFPDYHAVVPEPKKMPHKVKVGASNLRAALRRVSIMTNGRAPSVKLSLQPHKLKVAASAADLGEGWEVMDADCKVEDFGIVFNPRYILDFLKVVSDKQIQISCKSPKDSAHLRAGENGHVYVLMPLALDA